MQIERLRAKLESMEKRGEGEGLLSAARQDAAQLSSPDKRRVELLEKQIFQLKQEKQMEEMKRLEAESALKVMERRVQDLMQQQQHKVVAVGHESMRIQELTNQIGISEEKRREEEKKRAILEGKVRHLENQAKQNSPFRFQKLGRKPPPAHLPDINEGKEVVPMMNAAFMVQQGSPDRSPTLDSVDGPMPDGMGMYRQVRMCPHNPDENVQAPHHKIQLNLLHPNLCTSLDVFPRLTLSTLCFESGIPRSECNDARHGARPPRHAARPIRQHAWYGQWALLISVNQKSPGRANGSEDGESGVFAPFYPLHPLYPSPVCKTSSPPHPIPSWQPPSPRIVPRDVPNL